MKKLLDVQNVRLLDVFVLSPFLFYASIKQENKVLKYGLFLIGAGTLIYNGINYINHKKK
jgi:hypothetical protein